MRSSTILKISFTVLVMGALSACLVSETPVLDASTGKAKPVKPGDYISCPIEDDDDDADCDALTITRDASGLYSVVSGDDEAMKWRFRRVGRGGYAVQVKENDGYAYYYGRIAGEALRMTFMQCPALPESLRASLIANGDLESEDDDFETCAVITVRGLTKAAKAYHRGETQDDEPLTLVISPAASLPQSE